MLNTLKSAIEARVPIEFNYIKSEKDPGVRVGNAHAIYIGETLSGQKSTKVDIVQTAGVSDSQTPFPSWRTFDLNDLSGITLIEGATQFEPHHCYKPTSDRYDSLIKKV